MADIDIAKAAESLSNMARFARAVSAADDVVRVLQGAEQTSRELKQLNDLLRSDRDKLAAEIATANDELKLAKAAAKDVIAAAKAKGETIVADASAKAEALRLAADSRVAEAEARVKQLAVDAAEYQAQADAARQELAELAPQLEVARTIQRTLATQGTA